MNLHSIIEEEKLIQKRVAIEYRGPSGKSELIGDGIICPKLYLSSSPRILWILKEPYDNGTCYDNPEDGGWNYPYEINHETDKWSRMKPFQPICYINYGIWTGMHDWDEMPCLRDSEEIRNGLKKIAFINVSKEPGLKHSPSPRIIEAYKKHRGLILDQIKTYAPNIIFACSPHAELILQDLGFSSTQWKKFGSSWSVQITSEQRLVWVYHPSSRKKRDVYVNDAIKAATTSLVAD